MPLFGTFIWNPCGTWNLWVSNVYVEPRVPESLFGTVVEPGTFMEPQKCGTLGNLNFMWKLCGPWIGEPELLRLEPLCGTLGNLVPGFGRLPQTTAKLYWKNPKLSSCWGKTGWTELTPDHWWAQHTTTPGLRASDSHSLLTRRRPKMLGARPLGSPSLHCSARGWARSRRPLSLSLQCTARLARHARIRILFGHCKGTQSEGNSHTLLKAL